MTCFLSLVLNESMGESSGDDFLALFTPMIEGFKSRDDGRSIFPDFKDVSVRVTTWEFAAAIFVWLFVSSSDFNSTAFVLD